MLIVVCGSFPYLRGIFVPITVVVEMNCSFQPLLSEWLVFIEPEIFHYFSLNSKFNRKIFYMRVFHFLRYSGLNSRVANAS